MKIFLGYQDIWDIVETMYEKPTKDANKMVAQGTTLKKTRVKDSRLCIFCTMLWTASRRLQMLHLQRKHGIFWRLYTKGTTRSDKSDFKLSEESLKG